MVLNSVSQLAGQHELTGRKKTPHAQSSAPKPTSWGSHGPKGVPGSNHPAGEQHCCCSHGAMGPLWFSRRAEAGHSHTPPRATPGAGQGSDPPDWRVAAAQQPLSYLGREAELLSGCRSVKHGTGDRTPHSSSTWNCAGARALPDSSSSLPMVNCRDDSPESTSQARQPLAQSLAHRSSPCPHRLVKATPTSPTCPTHPGTGHIKPPHLIHPGNRHIDLPPRLTPPKWPCTPSPASTLGNGLPVIVPCCPSLLGRDSTTLPTISHSFEALLYKLFHSNSSLP